MSAEPVMPATRLSTRDDLLFAARHREHVETGSGIALNDYQT
jgi:hypothetical protein